MSQPPLKSTRTFKEKMKVMTNKILDALEEHLKKKTQQENVQSFKYVVGVFYACIFLTLVACTFNVYKFNIFEQQNQAQLISKLNARLDETFQRYFTMMYGVRAVFSIAPDMTKNRWTAYGKEVVYTKRYPGIMGLSIVNSIQRTQLPGYLANEQQVNQRSLKIITDPKANSSEMNIVQYAYDVSNRSPEGLDIRQFPNTRRALDTSRDNDKTAIIFYSVLPMEKTDPLGPVAVILTPIYKGSGQPLDTLTRREKCLGWVCVPFHVHPLFKAVLASDPDFDQLHVSVDFADNPHESLVINPERSSQNNALPSVFTKEVAGLKFTLNINYVYGGLSFYGGKIVIPNSLFIMFGIGLLIAILAAAFFWSIFTMRQRALDLANKMTTNLFRQEQKYRALIQNAPGVIFSCIKDLNWRMNYLSDQFQKITGYNPDEFLENKRRYVEIVHPDDIYKVEKTVSLKPQLNHEYFLDYRIIHANGSVRWMHERAKVVRSPQTQELYLTGHFFDITDQKGKESEYRNLVNALENAVNGVGFINANGYHTQVNEAYADIMDGTPQDLQYKNFFDLLSDTDQVNVRALLDNFVDQKRQVVTVEARSLTGSHLFLSLVLVPAFSDGANKKSIGFYVFAKDISSDIRRENQLSEAVKAAEAANMTKSTFLATMSHELRTPLNAIIGYSDMLIEDALDDQNEMLVGDLKKINNSGRHLLSLINDILDVSKLEAGKMTIHLEVFDIKESAQSMLDIIHPAAEKNNNTVLLDIQEDIGEMYSDVTKLRQMVFNLLSNACKFTKDGTVHMNITASIDNNHEYVHFAVSDSGIGITDEQMKNLFQPFTQADSSTTRNFGGTGLGLTITKKFSEILGGRIDVHSEYGKGTTFTIILPRNTKHKVADAYNNKSNTLTDTTTKENGQNAA